MAKLAGEYLVERMSAAERARAERVESVLPALREAAVEVDIGGDFERSHVARFREAGLLGLVVPESFGGLGGGLRDLAAATFALGTACPSTALAFFFHCSAAARGLLPLSAIEAGLFSSEEIPAVRAFAEKVLTRMGREGMWLANFASESIKTEASAVTVGAEAQPVAGGFALEGVKAFGCATGVADAYLVTAKLAGFESAEGLATFFVDPQAQGVGERQRWDAIGMRGTATHGITLKGVHVPAEEALAIPGAFARTLQVSRGSFVGNQLAGTAVYAGAAAALYRESLTQLQQRKFEDTGRPLGSGPFYQELIGRMLADLTTALLWLRRQLELETSEPPLLPKDEVVKHWRLCKGEACEAAFRVAVGALKAGGTAGTANRGGSARALRNLAMGLVQAFPAERGRLMAAQSEVTGAEQAMFGVAKEPS
ncbi:MAG: acyl-CoA/acyl-ACP dehydrogenase [Deltaproteobacteria bacterium]|nr:acyl-CoA/acyl-ACP dehydrogenase [Deltaproteobacteria bacterium]MDD9853512.1 acyl-CoA/acyl-ACP dehydrogenase [Deltaproteobacteria bacterium]MDD9872346.1 acyl-CoA/acyl-ACP dehydrogenase [Deltaproteobacteria bacterium]